MNSVRKLLVFSSLLLVIAGFCRLAQAQVSRMQITQAGEFVQGGIVRGQVPAGTSVELDGKAVKVGPAGEFVIGFGRDQEGVVTLVFVDAEGSRSVQQEALRKRDYEIQRIEGVAKKYVSPPKETQKRIQDDAHRVRLARQAVLERTDFAGAFIWPAKGVISGVYGSQRFFNGEPRRPHFGVDIAAPTGTPVYAPAGGKVTLVRDLYFSGWTVILDHGHGLSSSFLHLDKASVEVGQELKQGDLLGLMGATGRVTGPHLDWRMNWYSQRVDPAVLVEGKPEKLTQD